MSITKYLLGHGLWAACLYKLHLESGRNYCIKLSLLSQPREERIWCVCCYGCFAIGAVSSVQFSCPVVSTSLWPHGLQHARLLCPSPIPGACSNSCPLSWWCHPAISSYIIHFSPRLQSFPASGSFPMSRFFPSGGQSIRVSASASVLPMNIQDWFPLEWTDLNSFESKQLSIVFNNTVQKHQFFGTQISW